MVEDILPLDQPARLLGRSPTPSFQRSRQPARFSRAPGPEAAGNALALESEYPDPRGRGADDCRLGQREYPPGSRSIEEHVDFKSSIVSAKACLQSTS